jgi:hypothetical protein
MIESVKLLYKDILHSEIYNSNLPLKQMLFLQDKLDNKHDGNFSNLLQDILEYAILPEVEDYETAAKIRDYRIEIKE